MNKIECKVCSEGSLELRELSKFPSPTVQRLGGYLLFGAQLIFVISIVILVIIPFVAISDSNLLPPAVIVGVLGVEPGIAINCLFFALLGALLTMTKPTLQCDNCSATTPAS